MNIALISPNENAYSETFIQAHKNGFDGNVFYYYSGYMPTQLENYGMFPTTVKDKLSYVVKKLMRKNIDQQYFKERTLIRSFKKNKIDVVYAEYGPTGAAITSCCKKLNLPLIVNFHGFDASAKEVIDEYGEQYKVMFEYAFAIIAVSKKMIESLIKLGCSEEKIHYIACAPDNKFFDIQPTYLEDSFIAIGRFTEKKAPYYTILAFNEVLKKRGKAILYMVGTGSLLSICQNIVKHLRIEDNVKFIGVCPHDELLKYIEKVKGFVQHSIIAPNGDSEGTPVAVLEALASALPVISTKHAGISDVVVDNVSGYLVEEHDTHTMAQRMLFLLEEPHRCKDLGAKGRQFIKENYTMNTHLRMLNELIFSSLAPDKNK